MNKILEQIKEVFKERNLEYRCVEDEYIGEYVQAQLDGCMVEFKGTNRSVRVRLCRDRVVPEARRTQVLRALNKINVTIKEGHWEMGGDGTLCFRIGVDLEGIWEIETARLVRLLEKVLQANEDFEKQEERLW